MNDEQIYALIEGLNQIARAIDCGFIELKTAVDNIMVPDNYEIANQLLELNKCMDKIIDIGHSFESGNY